MAKKKQAKIKKVKERPERFQSFTDCLKWTKKAVYLIARGRENPDTKETNWITLGTSFLAAPNRIVTAGHVLIDKTKGEPAVHKDGDTYLLIKHDDDNNVHGYLFHPKLDKEMFVYPEIDLGIMYVEDNFYDGTTKKEDFIPISKNFAPIGTEISVLGYPLCLLSFENKDFSKPKIGAILLRVDKGVINCRYQINPTSYMYEFTLNFNPGNSGGPIISAETGRLLSLVNGFNTIPIIQKESLITEEGAKQLKAYKEKAFIETIYATYSKGFATPSFVEIFKQHKII